MVIPTFQQDTDKREFSLKFCQKRDRLAEMRFVMLRGDLRKAQGEAAFGQILEAFLRVEEGGRRLLRGKTRERREPRLAPAPSGGGSNKNVAPGKSALRSPFSYA